MIDGLDAYKKGSKFIASLLPFLYQVQTFLANASYQLRHIIVTSSHCDRGECDMSPRWVRV